MDTNELEQIISEVKDETYYLINTLIGLIEKQKNTIKKIEAEIKTTQNLIKNMHLALSRICKKLNPHVL